MKLKPNETYVRIQFLEWGRKIDIIRNNSEKQIWTHKEKTVKGKCTSSKIVMTQDGIFCQGTMESH